MTHNDIYHGMFNEWRNTTKNLINSLDEKLSNVVYVRRNQDGIQLIKMLKKHLERKTNKQVPLDFAMTIKKTALKLKKLE